MIDIIQTKEDIVEQIAQQLKKIDRDEQLQFLGMVKLAVIKENLKSEKVV